MEGDKVGFFDSLFSSSSGRGNVPDYLKNSYEKFGLDPDDEGENHISSNRTKMYCTQCRKIYNGGYKCIKCDNILVEWH